MRIIHPLKPIFDKNSQILILGSFPSIISRQEKFYYANKQNRFWKVLEGIYDEKIIDKEQFLLKHHIALWDVVYSCEINGSNDNSIKNVKVNNISFLLKKTNITKIFLNGRKAYNLYKKYWQDKITIPAIYLPSTSPANANYQLKDLIEVYKIICKIDIC